MPDFHYKHKLTKAQQQQQNLKAATSGSTANKTSPQNKPVPKAEPKSGEVAKSEVVAAATSSEDLKSKVEVQSPEVGKPEEDIEEEVTRPVDKNDVD